MISPDWTALIEWIEEFLESWAGFFGGAAFAVGFMIFGYRLDPDRLPPLFSAVISVSAISVGFLGTAKAILITISNRTLIKQLKDAEQYDRLMRYLQSAMWLSLSLVVLSASYLLVDFRSIGLSTFIFLLLWFFFTGAALCTNARIIYNFGKILRKL